MYRAVIFGTRQQQYARAEDCCLYMLTKVPDFHSLAVSPIDSTEMITCFRDEMVGGRVAIAST